MTNRKPSDGEEGPRGTFRMDHLATGEPTPVDPIPLHLQDLREAAARELLMPSSGPQNDVRASSDRAGLKVSVPAPTRGRPLTVRMQVPAASDPEWSRTTHSDLDLSEASAQRLHVGQAVGAYIVAGFIASGGFAEIYKVRHAVSGELRALKLLCALHAGRQDSVERLVNEGRTLLRLREIANVVYVFEMFETLKQGVCIVMELLDDGLTLLTMLERERRLKLEVAIEIVMKVAQTLATVHTEDVIHRDLSPANIYVRKRVRDGVTVYYPLVLDLGCAKTPDGPSTSSKVATVGTWKYISPEQVGRGEIGPWSDVYSLNCILYEIVNGESCFAEQAQRAGGAANADFLKFGWHIFAEPRIPDWTPVRLWNDVMARNLEKAPDSRHRNMVEYARALHAFWTDLREGRLTSQDRTMACDAGALARKAPKPLPPIEAKPAVVDVPPAEIGISEDCPFPSLLVTDGPLASIGKRYRIGRRVVIGRTLPAPMKAEADLTFELASISARHVELQMILEGQAEAVFNVSDLGGRNGTQLNGVVSASGVLCPPGTIRLAGVLELELCAPGVPSLERLQRPFAKRLQREREGLANTLPTPRPAPVIGPKYDPPPDKPARQAATLVDRQAPTSIVDRGRTPRWAWILVLVLLTFAVLVGVLILLAELHVIGAKR